MEQTLWATIRARFEAARIMSLVAPVRTQAAIVPPGACFPLAEFAGRLKPPPGKVWIRHENFNCYEVDEHMLTGHAAPGVLL